MQLPGSQIPTLQKAVVCLPNLKPGIADDAVLPDIEQDMVLVKTEAVALNPTDYKMVDNFPHPGAISGCDFAGTIVAIGPGVTQSLAIGDRVCGGVHGANPIAPAIGAFGQYVGATADILCKMPDSMSFEDGAAIGGAGPATMALAIRDSLGLTGTLDQPTRKPEYVLVYGGSTATGTMAIQFLKMGGYKPIATCSPRNNDLIKSYGAEATFDYRSPTCGADIRAYTKNSLRYALDCITEVSTTEICLASLGRAGGRYCALEIFPAEMATRKTVKMDWVLAITIFGRRIALERGYEREADSRHRVLGKSMFEEVEMLLEKGMLRPHPVKLMKGGIDGILQGLDLLRRKKVSGEKLVYKIES